MASTFRVRRALAWTLAYGAAVVASAPRVAGSDDGGVSVAAKPSDAPSPQSLEAAWKASPNDVALGLRLEDALVAAGRRPYAVELFRRGFEAVAPTPVAAFLHGRMLGGAKGAALMRGALEQRLGLAAGHEEGLADAWEALVETDQRERLWADAARDAAVVAERTGRAGDTARLGRLRERAGDDAGARKAYEQAIGVDDRSLAARGGLVALLARTGAKDDAVRVARETVALLPDEPWAHVQLGQALASQGHAREARQAYVSALLRAGDDVGVLVTLGATFTEMEDYAAAHKALDRAVSLAPLDGTALAAAGTLSIEEGKPVVAGVLLARAAQACPDDARIAFLTGVAAERAKEYARAVEAYGRAARLEPHVASYAIAKALALEVSGDTDGAIAAFRAAMDLSPQDASLPLRLGGLYEDKGKWQKAEEAYLAAARLAPKSADAHFFLAVVYGDHLSRPQSALDELRAYRALGGTEPAALRWLQQLEDAKGK